MSKQQVKRIYFLVLCVMLSFGLALLLCGNALTAATTVSEDGVEKENKSEFISVEQSLVTPPVDSNKNEDITKDTTSTIILETPEVEVDKEEETIAPTNKIDLSEKDRETLARLVYLEANIESVECQRAVVSVVINRLNSGYWGDTIDKVVYAKNQFTPARLISSTTPTQKNYEAVDYVLENGVTLPEYVLYFRANYHFSWKGYNPYISIDRTYFGYMSKDKAALGNN